MSATFITVSSVSGGKDSAAMALHLRDRGIEAVHVFCDTGWEHPATYEYIRGPLTDAIGPIVWLRSEVTLPDDREQLARAFEARLGHYSPMVRWILSKGMFPSRQRRFCTEQLKVLPIAEYLRPMAEAAPGWVVNAVGIRAGESFARSQLPEWEASNLGIPAVTWRPLREWSEADVIAIHKRHGLTPNPLYMHGASRVGCWPCIYARKAEILMLAKLTPSMSRSSPTWNGR